MTVDELRAAADDLVTLHQRFAPFFGSKQAQEHARCYLQGLLLAEGRKSAEPLALRFGAGLRWPSVDDVAPSPDDGGAGAPAGDADTPAPQRKTPELTLDLAVRALQAALPRPTFTATDALTIIEYHLKRNGIAKQSHCKTWKRTHKKLEFKLLL
jgi:hypothetical protein